MGGIERGERNLTIQTIATVASGLGVTLSELFADIEKQVEAVKPPKKAKG